MKMSDNTLCCESCFTKIAKEDTRAARIWLDLCLLSLHSEVFGLMIEEDEALRFLEMNGYITTTENPFMILVKVHGFQREDDIAVICIGNCHE